MVDGRREAVLEGEGDRRDGENCLCVCAWGELGMRSNCTVTLCGIISYIIDSAFNFSSTTRSVISIKSLHVCNTIAMVASVMVGTCVFTCPCVGTPSPSTLPRSPSHCAPCRLCCPGWGGEVGGEFRCWRHVFRRVLHC